MGTLSRVTTWNSGDKPTASELNGEFDNILTGVNGNVTNANINASADIDASKLLDSSVTSRKLDPTMGVVESDADLSLTTSFQDVSGCTVTLSESVASTVFVTAVFDFDIGTSNTGVGCLSVDGTEQSEYARAVGEIEGTFSQVWAVDIDAGSNIVKLRAKSTAGGGTCGITHTKMMYFVIAQ